MKVLKRGFLIMMISLILLPLVTLEWRHNVASEINNAILKELDISSGFSPSDVDAWIADRVGFRTQALTTSQLLDDRLFHELSHPSYMYGKDGYVFFKLQSSANEVDTDFLDAFCAYLKQIQDYCESRGVPFLYAITPEKKAVYDQYLPDGYLYQDTFFPALYAKLEEYGVLYTSNVELLREKAATEQVFNRKYDAGHWNDLGEYYAVNDLLEEVQKEYPNVEPWTMDDFEVSTVVEEFLPLSRFPIHEEVPQFSNLLSGEMKSIGGFTSLYRHPSHQAMYLYCRTDKNAENLPKVLMFHGSFYNRNPLLYACAFQESYGIHNYQNILYFPYYFNIFQPDYVIVSSAQNATTRNYFDYNTLRSVRLNVPMAQVEEAATVVCPLDELVPTYETEDRLTTVTLRVEEPMNFGYLVTVQGEELDLLKKENNQFVCTVDNKRILLEGATVYLFE